MAALLHSELLRQAKTLAVEHNTTGAFARNAQGEEVRITSPEACAFCASGAIKRVVFLNETSPGRNWELQNDLQWRAHKVAGRLATRHGLVYVNDTMGVEAVAQVFDLAIAQAEVEERLEAEATSC